MINQTIHSLLLLSLISISHSILAQSSLFDRSSLLTQTAFDGHVFVYYNQDLRIDKVNQLYKIIFENYAGLELKKKRLNLDIKELHQKSIDEEMAVKDVKTAQSKVKRNMEFYDRLLKYSSNFKDSHLNFNLTNRRSIVQTGLILASVKGEEKKVKVIIHNINSKLLNYNQLENIGDEYSNIKLGDEVLAIDGIEVLKSINALRPYLGESQIERETLTAAYRLMHRYYKYPTSKTVKITIKHQSNNKVITYEIPWAYTTPQRADVALYFKNLDLENITKLKIGFNEDETIQNESIYYNGHSRLGSHSLKNIEIQNKYYSKKGSLILENGYGFYNQKTYTYIRFKSFSHDTIYLNENEKDIIDVFSEILTKAEERNQSIVLDMRINNGGSVNLSNNLVNLFSKDGEAFKTPFVYSVKITPSLIEHVDNQWNKENKATRSGKDSQNNFLRYLPKIIEATKSKKTFTSSIQPKLKKDLTGLFSGPLITLIDVNCISACEFFVGTLKENKRSIILGRGTAAAGIGYTYSESFPTTRSDTGSLFSINIPNLLFGPMKTNNNDPYDFCIENKPIKPHVYYTPTTLDVTDEGADWLKLVEESLDVLDEVEDKKNTTPNDKEKKPTKVNTLSGSSQSSW